MSFHRLHCGLLPTSNVGVTLRIADQNADRAVHRRVVVALRLPHCEVEGDQRICCPVHEPGRQPVVLGDGQRLPVSAGQVLDVGNQVVAEHIEHLALEFIAVMERLVEQVVRSARSTA